MTKVEQARKLRQIEEPHYNCAQAVLMPFAQELGMTPEQVRQLTAHCGGGFGCGGTCGALAGAVLATGGLGLPMDVRNELTAAFAEQHGALNCGELVPKALERGLEKKPFCNGLVEWCVAYLCRAAELE